MAETLPISGFFSKSKYTSMVRENCVFCTSGQKVSSEDILRALRVSSFFPLSGAYVLMDIRHDLPGRVGEIP